MQMHDRVARGLDALVPVAFSTCHGYGPHIIFKGA